MSSVGNSPSNQKWPIKILFWVGVIFTLVIPISIGLVFEDTSTSWIAAICGSFITFMSKLGEIAELSMGPVKAKMRETIREANATIDQLQNIAKDITEASLAVLMAGNFGFEDGLDSGSRLDIHDRLIAGLKEIGVPDDRITETDERWKKGVGVIYHRAIGPLIDERKVPHLLNPNATKEQVQARKGWDDLLQFDKLQAPTPDEMESYLASEGLYAGEIMEWVSDYRHFLETSEIRRRDVFVTK